MSGLGDVSGGSVIEEEEDGSVSTLMVRGCNGRVKDNLGAIIVHLFHWTSNKLPFVQQCKNVGLMGENTS